MHGEAVQTEHRWLRRRPKPELFEFVCMFARSRREVGANERFFDHERLTAELARDGGDEREHAAVEVQDCVERLATMRIVDDRQYDYDAALGEVFDLDRIFAALGDACSDDLNEAACDLVEAVAGLVILRAEEDHLSQEDVEHATELLAYAIEELEDLRREAIDLECPRCVRGELCGRHEDDDEDDEDDEDDDNRDDD